MRQDVLDGHRRVGAAERPGKSGAGRGECGKAEALEEPGAPDVPGIRNDETPSGVELAEPRDVCVHVCCRATRAACARARRIDSQTFATSTPASNQYAAPISWNAATLTAPTMIP